MTSTTASLHALSPEAALFIPSILTQRVDNMDQASDKSYRFKLSNDQIFEGTREEGKTLILQNVIL